MTTSFHLSHSKAALALALLVVSSAFLEAKSETPAVIAPYLKKGQTVSGEIGTIVPPKEINKYIAKVQAAAKADPVWHKEYAKNAKPGIPLPWHEKLGLTKDDYIDYIKLWDLHKFKAIRQVVIRLEEPKPGEWMMRVSGVGMSISLLRYNPKTDTFKSPNGELTRIKDIVATKQSILGEWKGKEWRFEQESDFISTKENLALGKYKDGKYCLLIYRLQESSGGYRLANKSLVIRFTPPKK